MNPSEEQKGTAVPPAGGTSAGEGSLNDAPKTGDSSPPHTPEPVGYDDGYPHEPPVQDAAPVAVKPEPPPTKEVARVPRRPAGGGKTPPPPPPASGSEGGGGDDEEDRMLRMSFLEHLE